MADVLSATRRVRRLLVSCARDSGANKHPGVVTAHRSIQRKSKREPRIVCAAKKKVNVLVNGISQSIQVVTAEHFKRREAVLCLVD